MAMAQAATVDHAAQPGTQAARLYPPSWVDRLTDAVRRLPGPSLFYYLGAWLVLLALELGIKWADGTYPIGTVFPFHIVLTLNAVYVVALMHYLDNMAERALAHFRPAISVSDTEYARLRYELTTLPARPTLVASAIGAAWITIFLIVFAGNLLGEAKVFTSPVATVLDVALLLIIWWSNGALVYHTIHQLQLVSRIYSLARVNLFRLGPLYAFSALTARTAVGWLFITYAFIGSLPGLVNNAAVIGSVLGLTLLAVITFALPLLGIHGMLEAEKHRLLDEAGAQLELSILETHGHLDEHALDHVPALKTAMEYLLAEKEMLAKLPTWPWQPGTIGGLGAALILPIVLWAIQHVLERFF
jgi:hypothetical protein